jgi:HEAT repeat protein
MEEYVNKSSTSNTRPIMTIKSKPVINPILRDLPDNLTSLILELLDKKNFSLKIDARNTLVSMGKKILPQLHKVLSADNDDLRKEVVKIVELIADPKSISILITLLDDSEFDIRWIAAEGLIRIGRRSIVPLLKSIRDGKCSYFTDKRAHHVLGNLLTESEKNDLETLLLSLDDYLKAREIAPTEAAKALEKYWLSD